MGREVIGLMEISHLNLEYVNDFETLAPDLSSKYPFPILGCPHQMVLRIIYTVAGSSCNQPLLYIILLPTAATILIPAPPGGARECYFSSYLSSSFSRITVSSFSYTIFHSESSENSC